jgi:hypothetical protein
MKTSVARSPAWWALALAVVVVAVYWPGLGGGFAFDDYHNIVLNPALKPQHWGWSEWLAATFSSPASSLQRPVAMFSLALNAWMSGLNPWHMKLTNVLIHALNSALVFMLCRRLLEAVDPQSEKTGRDKVALFIAACWALAPINLMAVLYVVQRMESLSHSFVLLGLWVYLEGRVRQRSSGQGWPLIFLGLFGCTVGGLGAKESAALLPVYCLLMELLVLRFEGQAGRTNRALIAMYGILVIAPALLGLAVFLPWALDPGQYAGRSFSLGQRLLTEPLVLLTYLRWTWLPDLSQLSLYHDDWVVSTGPLSPPATLVGLVAIPALALLAVLLRRRRPLSSLGLAWFLAAHLLTATILPLELVFEHRNYFSSLGLMLVLADLLLLAPRGKRLAGVLTGLSFVLVLAYAGLTHLRAREWSDPLRFALSESAKHPDSPRASFDAARALILLSGYRTDSPVKDAVWKALEKARTAPGSGVLPHQAALIYAYRSHLPVADYWWTDMQARLRSRPAGPEAFASLVALTNCAVVELCDFPKQRMIDTYAAALSKGQPAGVQSNYGKYAVHVLHDAPLALKLWTSARDGEPGNPVFRSNLAMLYAQLGQQQEANREVASLRGLGRFGQFRKSADELQAYVDAVIKQRQADASSPTR